MKEIDSYFLEKQEPVRSSLLALRNLILNFESDITEVWRYKMPFYCYKGKRFCYLWVDRKRKIPYLGIVDGKKVKDTELISEKRSRMKIMLIDPTKDLPLRKVKKILRSVLS